MLKDLAMCIARGLEAKGLVKYEDHAWNTVMLFLMADAADDITYPGSPEEIQRILGGYDSGLISKWMDKMHGGKNG